MKILVVSHKRFGKDTFCEIVQKHFGIKFVSSSDFMNKKLIFPALKDLYGYKTLKECYEDRDNHRKEWYDLIREYNKDDQTRLAREILEENDIYCGMRCGVQLEASKHLFDLIIWIDAEDRIGQIEGNESMSISKEQADLIITNNGTEKEFEEKVVKVMGLILKGEEVPIEDRQEEFRRKVWAYYFKHKDKYRKEVVTAFISYWNRIEVGKLKHETKKKFQIGRRMTTFSKKQDEIENQNRLNRFKNYLGAVNPNN